MVIKYAETLEYIANKNTANTELYYRAAMQELLP